jgi:hypothetical protein
MTLASSGPVSDFYYSSHTWTLPAKFNATDYIFTGGIIVPGYAEIFSPDLNAKTSTTAPWFDLCMQTLGNLTAYVDLFAFGRWK